MISLYFNVVAQGWEENEGVKLAPLEELELPFLYFCFRMLDNGNLILLSSQQLAFYQSRSWTLVGHESPCNCLVNKHWAGKFQLAISPLI